MAEDFLKTLSDAQSKSKSVTAIFADKIGATDLSESFVEDSLKFEAKYIEDSKGVGTWERVYDKKFLKKWSKGKLLSCGVVGLTKESSDKIREKDSEFIWYDFNDLILYIKMKSGEVYGVRSSDFNKCLNHVVSILKK